TIFSRMGFAVGASATGTKAPRGAPATSLSLDVAEAPAAGPTGSLGVPRLECSCFEALSLTFDRFLAINDPYFAFVLLRAFDAIVHLTSTYINAWAFRGLSKIWVRLVIWRVS